MSDSKIKDFQNRYLKKKVLIKIKKKTKKVKPKIKMTPLYKQKEEKLILYIQHFGEKTKNT